MSSSVYIGLCSENLAGVSNLNLDSTGGQISCGAGSNYSSAVTTYLASCASYSGQLKTLNYQNSDTVSISLSGSYNCAAAADASLLSKHQLSLMAIIVLSCFFLGVGIGTVMKAAKLGLR